VIIPLINPHRSRNKIIAGKVLRHLKKDINEMRHEMQTHRVLIRRLRKVNPCGSRSNPWQYRRADTSTLKGLKEAERLHTSGTWKQYRVGLNIVDYSRYVPPTKRQLKLLKRPAVSSRDFINPLSKERSMRFSLLRRRTHKRRAARRRHNPRFGIHRPTLLFGPGGWHRRPRSRLMRRGTRVNPRHTRRFRHYRHNPVVLPFNIGTVAIGGLKVAAGIGGGFLLKPFIAGFLPKDKITGKPMFINFFGFIYVVVGAVAASMIKQKDVKDVALVLAGVGVYDLIASNLKMLGLPQLPYAKAPAGVTAGDEPGVIGSSYQQAGADYAPALGSSYQEAGGDDISYGGDSVEIE